MLTVTDGQTAKVTDAAEVPTKGRATAGVRITKFRTEKRLEWAYVGPEDGVVLVGRHRRCSVEARPVTRSRSPFPTPPGTWCPRPPRAASSASASAAGESVSGRVGRTSLITSVVGRSGVASGRNQRNQIRPWRWCWVLTQFG